LPVLFCLLKGFGGNNSSIYLSGQKKNKLKSEGRGIKKGIGGCGWKEEKKAWREGGGSVVYSFPFWFSPSTGSPSPPGQLNGLPRASQLSPCSPPGNYTLPERAVRPRRTLSSLFILYSSSECCCVLFLLCVERAAPTSSSASKNSP
jgi:hypothetical protein